ncbi:MAG: extradiol ring-cleavage dioxygenase [Cyanobium sp. CACIAM 14]|nr:MAG: extradiol ring-cleavage dioxygenase [Cyanobium sp. CACIAM 14]
MSRRRRALYLSHGAGPLPLLGEASHGELLARLQEIAGAIEWPSAIVVVSAHWEEGQPTLTAGPSPPLLHDYVGFPPEAYAITYPCPGNPQLARRIAGALAAHVIAATLDATRGFDHGLFVPLAIMVPQADIPCLQLSLVRSLDPAEHLALGRALRDLDHGSLLLIGSGFSFHNMRAFSAPDTAATRAMNLAFEQWLQDTCANPELPEAEREQRLLHWESAPSARYCHPREEHLLPLHVCYGYAGAACTRYFSLRILNKTASLFLWEIDG